MERYRVLDLVMAAVAISLAAYVTSVWMLAGGIIEMVDAFKSTPVNVFGVALGAIRILTSGLAWRLTLGVAFIASDVFFGTKIGPQKERF
ncbi:hypothetical protein [Ferrovum sp.]|uniref:hypothetical protein n=1 Tax=Ferrovum sp. TaxID=2609467 RepID=UPI002609FF93|nr:hypothetical protein [Ferrovum sp.]